MTRRLIAGHAVKAPSRPLSARIQWAAEWAHDTGIKVEKVPEEARASISAISKQWDPQTVAALKAFAQSLARSKTAEEVQGAAFAAVRESGAEPAKFFTAVYRILLGTERGPRLGPYIMDAGREVVAEKIAKALSAGRYN